MCYTQVACRAPVLARMFDTLYTQCDPVRDSSVMQYVDLAPYICILLPTTTSPAPVRLLR